MGCHPQTLNNQVGTSIASTQWRAWWNARRVREALRWSHSADCPGVQAISRIFPRLQTALNQGGFEGTSWKKRLKRTTPVKKRDILQKIACKYIYISIHVIIIYAYDIKETFGGAAYTFTLSFFSAMDRSDRTLILFKTIGDKVPCQFIPMLSLFTSQVAFQPAPTHQPCKIPPDHPQGRPAVTPLQHWTLRHWRFAGDWTKDRWTGAVGPALAPPGVEWDHHLVASW